MSLLCPTVDPRRLDRLISIHFMSFEDHVLAFELGRS